MTRERHPDTRRAPRRGSALLEVAVAIALLGLTGTALVALMGQSGQSLDQVRRREIDVRRASDELARLSAYDRGRLLASAGSWLSRGWIVSVAPSAPDLFDIAVVDTTTKLPILQTTLYRPDTLDAATP